MTGQELRADAGQLVIMGCNGVEMSPALAVVLRAIRPGGVILFARNIVSATQTWELLHHCREAAQKDDPLFLCVDLEGGTVDRLREVIAPAPSAAEIFSTGSEKVWRRHGRVLGEEARALCFNTDFAPVLDLAFLPSRSVLTTRVVSDDPRQADAYARQLLRGLSDAGVLGCGKHFPGLGEAALDTHHELPAVEKSFDDLWRQDIAPYRELRRELAFVMVAHANYPQVTGDKLPASLSQHWMRTILRKKIGYQGLILADDLEMGGVLSTPARANPAHAGDPANLAAADIGEVAVSTLRASADMFLVCHSEERVWAAYEAVVVEAERDRKFARLVAERARHVRAGKRRMSALKRGAPPPTERVLEQLREAMEELREAIQNAKCKMQN